VYPGGKETRSYAWMLKWRVKARFWKDISKTLFPLKKSLSWRESLDSRGYWCSLVSMRPIQKRTSVFICLKKLKVFSRIRGAVWRCERINGSSFQMAVAIAAAVLSISTMGFDATAVEAFLVFSKCRLSVEFRCALCIDA